MADVKLSGIVKAFGAVQVLKGIDLDIRDGEFMVFVGPSGCGKSTLLRTIAGLEEVTGGEIRIGGQLVNDVPPAGRGIAMVFQSYALYPHMSLFDNMAFGLQLARVPRDEIERSVRRAAEILHIDHLLQRRPKDLSGGQRQRVAIGRAIVRQPAVFLFDEPLSNLDTALRVKMRYEFAKLHEQFRTTMVYVTHDQTEAMTLADRIAVLHAGRLEQVGTPMQLYEHPCNRFVAGFIGSPAMNIVAGRLEQADEAGAWVRLDAGERLRCAVDARALPAGAPLALGVRPEHLHPAADGAANTLATRVTFVESLGSLNYAYCSHGARRAAAPAPAGAGAELAAGEGDGDRAVGDGEPVTAALPGDRRPASGDVLALHVPPEKVHLFDADGRALPRLAAAEHRQAA